VIKILAKFGDRLS